MNTMPRGDGMKEKRAEFTLAPSSDRRCINGAPTGGAPQASQYRARPRGCADQGGEEPEPASWNAAPLVPDTDDIPF